MSPLVYFMVHAYGYMFRRLEALIISRVNKQSRIERMFIHVRTLTYYISTGTVFYLTALDN
jgi:hypothetical protein